MRDFREGDRVVMELGPNGWPRWDGLTDRGATGIYAKGEVTVAQANVYWVEFAPHDEHQERADWVFHQPSAAESIYRSGSGAPERVTGPCSCGAQQAAEPFHYDWCDSLPG